MTAIRTRGGYFRCGQVWLVFRWSAPWRQEEVVARTKEEAKAIGERIL